MSNHLKVIYVDQDRCLACRNCERVCSFQDSGGFIRENSHIWVRIDLENRTILTLTCLQCENAACMDICPVKAIRRDPRTHALVVDESLCVGCKMCVKACPFGCMHFNNQLCIASKCDLCGGNPKCVMNCMAGALFYGDINELAALKRQRK